MVETSSNHATRTRTFEDGQTKIGDATVQWRRIGSGPDLVFLPGFPLSGHTWDGVTSRLADRFRCHAFDLIGLGRSSSRNHDDYGSPGQGRVFQQLIRELGIERYGLIGNDTGGWIARELALLDVDRVSHLVLTNTEVPGHRPPWIPLYQAMTGLPGFGAVLGQLLKSRAYCRSAMAFGGVFHDLSRIDGEFRRLHIERLVRSPEAIEGARIFLNRMKFARLDEFRELHGKLRMPTLFLWGEDDPTFPAARGREMAKQFPNVAGFETFPNAKLFFYEEHPELVAGRIARFVAGA